MSKVPLYEYKCTYCGAFEVAVEKVEDRDEHNCKCGQRMDKLFSLTSRPQIVVEPYYSETIDSWIKSPKHKKEVLRAKNLEPVG